MGRLYAIPICDFGAASIDAGISPTRPRATFGRYLRQPRDPRALMKFVSLSLVFTFGASAIAATASGTTDAALERAFAEQVRPFVDGYCSSCHGEKEQKGDFDLRPYSTAADVAADFERWENVLEMLESEEMPPAKAKKHPSDLERAGLVAWIRDFRAHEAGKNAGDPGPVLARRLSNAEYNYTIHDLTGADIRPTREFPVDPANQAGFDNSGESLTMSPALLNKYLDAAREVAEHLVLTPDGLAFAPHPVVADTDRDKYSVLRIVDFYQRQPTDYAQYFRSAWRYRHRAKLGLATATLPEIAEADRVSPKYLETIWGTLNAKAESVGPLAELSARWRALPEPGPDLETVAPEIEKLCAELRDFVVTLRRKIVPEVKNLSAPLIQEGSQTLIMWKNRQMAANRRRFDPHVLLTPEEAVAEQGRREAEIVAQKAAREAARARRVAAQIAANGGVAPRVTPNTETPAIVQRGGKFLSASVSTAGSATTLAAVSERAPPDDPDLRAPADPVKRSELEAAFTRFAAIFPDAFYISERARVYLDAKDQQDNGGRLLSAGFHSMTGYFRDDAPLCELVLDDAGRRELEGLWQEFYFYAAIPARMHTSFVWFERTDSAFMRDPLFDPYRPEDKSVTTQQKIAQLAAIYLAKARDNGASETVQQAIREHFSHVAEDNAWLEQAHENAILAHLRDLVTFAERAYRRPLDAAEREDLLAFYRTSRSDNGLDHENAMRDSIARVLMSPHFCYRIDTLDGAAGAMATAAPVETNFVSDRADRRLLSAYALANRLSYFLWSSMPDPELLSHAATGDLLQNDVLVAQADRMLKDPRVRNFATEFAGHWLDFRRFEEHNAVDRERYPAFDDELRSAMFREPIEFLMHVVREDRPLQDLMFGDYTYVNAPLARHYGFEGRFSRDGWTRVDHVNALGRGGLLPMAVFLTANSPGLRTSPVKRGHWVVSQLLGERIPPPPPNVPVLPADEKQMGELTLRETLEKHRADPVCASCHARFDSFGLAFEGYGATGERRTLDFGGRPVDARADFPGGGSGDGLGGLRAYLQERRANDFVDNLCRKLLAYGLGRTLLLSDDALLHDMKAKLKADGSTFRALVETVVNSPQFRMRRVPPVANVSTASYP